MIGKERPMGFWSMLTKKKVSNFNDLQILDQIFILFSPFFLGVAFLILKIIFERYQHLLPAFNYFTRASIKAFLIVAVLTPILRFIALKMNVVDNSSSKELGKKTTALLGGVGIYIGLILILYTYRPLSSEVTGIMIACTIILVLGTIDDIYGLSSKIRLLGQVIASVIVMRSGLIVSFMPDTLGGEIIAYIITFIWIIGIINAMNFADGVDGLAAGITAIATFFFFLITLQLGEYYVALITCITIGATLGFLIYNFKPAKIYLGDGGSTMLGFLVACFALYGDWSEKGMIIASGIPILILGVLIFDMFYISISRLKTGQVKNFQEYLDYKGRDHFHYRLINLGFKERDAVIFIYFTSIILGLSALVLEGTRDDFPVAVLFIQAILIFVNITILMLVGRNIVRVNENDVDIA